MQQLEYYQRLVAHAQSEIADTYYLQGKHKDAAEFFGRLLKLNHPDLNKCYIMYKQIRSLCAQDKHDEASALSKLFLERYATAAEAAEVRFQLASSLRKLDRKQEALQQVLELLQQQESISAKNPELWAYWQQRAGNEIANQLYQEGDIFNALTIYQKLATLNQSPQWQAPVLYQTGLVYEKLRQYPKAMDTYNRILSHRQDLGTNAPSPSLTAVFELAQWRQNNLQWSTNMEHVAAVILGDPKPPKAIESKQ
jgi:tetratricopeptide (TPR) repeat protein